MFKTRTILKEKLRESLTSVLPVTLIVLALCFTISPMPAGTLLAFIFGALLLIIGMGFFTLGSDISMTVMGEYVGREMTKSKKPALIVFVALFVGVLITVSEPDLQVLSGQVPSIPNKVLIISVAAGVGIFLVASMLRILFAIQLRYILRISYIAVFTLAAFAAPEFIAVAFDSGGVTTGPMTVPFILAMGIGVSAVRSDKNAESDSFGLIALCSIGPILSVLILGMVYSPDTATHALFENLDIADTKQLRTLFASELPGFIGEVALAVAPIAVFFFIYQLFSSRLTLKSLAKIGVGVIYTYIGLVLFLTGANVGFMPAGYFLGSALGALEFKYAIVPIGMLIGYFIVKAEPAVIVLKKQVEDITAGAIRGKTLGIALAAAISAAVGLAMLRAVTGIPILCFLIPGYAVALALTVFTPKIFVSIAFDSGGVASGPMTATFLLPLSIGACEAAGGNPVSDAFGVVAFVAMMPLIAIQILGLIYKVKLRRASKVAPAVSEAEEIIEFQSEDK